MSQLPKRSNGERSDGHQIELFIADELRKRGFVILEQNYKMGFLEVDLIALEGDVLCFIEVKARNRPFVLSELDVLIPPTKQQNMVQVADVFCRNLRGYAIPMCGTTTPLSTCPTPQHPDKCNIYGMPSCPRSSDSTFFVFVPHQLSDILYSLACATIGT